MGSEGLPIDIIIFAAIAAFIVFRLRSVLGRRTGNERPPQGVFGPSRTAKRDKAKRDGDGDKVIQLGDRGKPEAVPDSVFDNLEPGTPLEVGLKAIRAADPSFNGDAFLQGAGGAFEMIIEAFAGGTMSAVKSFLSQDVFDNFSRAIAARDEAGETLETTMIGIKRADIIEAKVEERTAVITVKFVSEQINVTRDGEGVVVDGDPDHVTEVVDIWTFMRDVRSRNPNWVLVETRSAN